MTTVAGGCASVAPPEAAEPVALGEPAAVLDGQRYLEYRVGRNIKASPEAVWAVLTDGPAYPEWNSTVVSLDGTIAQGETIELVANVNFGDVAQS